MKNTKKYTMKTIAVTLAALSMMSTISMTAGAVEAAEAAQADILTETISADTTAAPEETIADVPADDTSIPAAAPEETVADAPVDEASVPAATPEETVADAPVDDASLPADSIEYTYTITFDTDGGTAVEPITAEAGAPITAPEAPTKDGFYFAGWSEPIPETMPEQDMTITAIWSDTPVEAAADETAADSTALTYTITLDTDGGTALDPITAEAGAPITAPEAPTKDGFYFKSWSAPIPEFMPEENTTIKAEWSETPVYDTIEEAFADKANLLFADEEGNVIDPTQAALLSDTTYDLNGPFLEESSMCFYSAGDVFSDIGDAFKELDMSKDQEALLKSIGTKMVDESFATIAKLYPGSGILLAPFQVLFHKGVDNDPMGKMDEKLNQIDGKLDKLSTKLEGISKNIEHSTEWIGRHMENVEDMSTIRKSFISLAPSAHELCKDIKGVETNTNYVNNFEKTFMIAKLGTEQNYKDVAKNVYVLQNHMYGGSTAFPNMYDAAYNLCADQRMISMEAYEDAKTMVDDLTMSYVSAVALMQEIETAQKAVENFGEKELAQLSPDIRAFYEFYKKHQMSRMKQNYGEVAAALLACAYGSHKFDQAYNNSDFINKGAVRKPLEVEYKTLYLEPGNLSSSPTYTAYESNHTKHSRSISNKDSSLNDTERQALVDYIRTKRTGMSIDEYLRRYGVKINNYRETDKTCRNIYLVTDDSVIEGIKLTNREDPDILTRIEFRDHTYTLKNVIEIHDTAVNDKALKFAKAKQEKKFVFDSEYSNTFYDSYSYYINYLFIY